MNFDGGMNGLNLSKLKYDEEGKIIFDESNELEEQQKNNIVINEDNKNTSKNTINQTTIQNEQVPNIPFPQNQKKITLNDIDYRTISLNNIPENAGSDVKAMALSQSIDEMERDMEKQNKRKKLKDMESPTYMNRKNTMIASILMMTLFGLVLGTFVFKDYITCTLIGCVLGIIIGRILCKNIAQDTEFEIKENKENKKENIDEQN